MRRLFLFVSVAAVAILAGCPSNDPPASVCKQSPDCASGVCRDGKCTVVTCTGPTGCSTGETCVSGSCVVSSGKSCKASSDCPSGAGVCRSGTCVAVSCGATSSCQADEQCVMGRCAPSSGGEGHVIAGGGGVSTSGKHIHISLTGQGKAVGRSSSAQHQTVTGGTKIMGR